MLKKTMFYLPAIISVLFIGFIKIATSISPLPITYVWLALLIISGVLLSKGRFWGGFFGMLPGIHLIYMSTQNTGQVINAELPSGITILAFYLLCSGFIFYRLKKQE